MLETLIGESKALEHAIAGEELSFRDGMELMEYDNLHLFGAVADNLRQKLVGDKVTFTSSSYLNYTNVCAASCQICAFYRKEGDTDSYRHLQNSEFEKIKRFCLEELPSPFRNYREITLKKLLENENFIITKDVVGESVSKLNPEGNPAYEEPKGGYKRAACEMIVEYCEMYFSCS